LQALGGQFQVYFTDEEVTDYRTAAKADSERFRVFQAEMLRQGVYALPITLFHHGIVAAHSREDLERIVAAMRTGLQRVKKEFGS
jgi:glutamate-1-semialdehyde 2,1-aminomutase